MRDADHRRRAILQLLRERGWRRAHCGFGSRGRARLRRTRSAAHPDSGEPLAGHRSFAIGRGLLDSYRRTNAALLDGLGNGRALRKLAVQFSPVWTLLDRRRTGDIRSRTSYFGLGTVSARAVGAPSRAGSWLSCPGTAAVWYGARHLHDLGAAARAFRPGIRTAFPRVLSAENIDKVLHAKNDVLLGLPEFGSGHHNDCLGPKEREERYSAAWRSGGVVQWARSHKFRYVFEGARSKQRSRPRFPSREWGHSYFRKGIRLRHHQEGVRELLFARGVQVGRGDVRSARGGGTGQRDFISRAGRAEGLAEIGRVSNH